MRVLFIISNSVHLVIQKLGNMNETCHLVQKFDFHKCGFSCSASFGRIYEVFCSLGVWYNNIACDVEEALWTDAARQRDV